MENLFLNIVAKDSNGIPYNIPNTQYKKWKINALGFRGEEIDFEKKEGQIRIMCFGASETFGFCESEGKEWPAQLGERLKDQYPEAEVINISVMGLRKKMRKAYIEKYVLPLNPDILVMNQHMFLPHLRDCLKGIEESVVSCPINENIKEYSNSHILANRLLSNFRNNILYKILPGRLLSSYRMWKQRKTIRTREKEHLHKQKPLDQVPENIILKYEEDLSSFVDYLKEKNIVPVMVTFPTLTTSSNKETYKTILINTRLTFCIEISENAIVDSMQKLKHLIQRIADRQNVACLDIDNLIPKTLEYYVDDFHYTDKGAEVFAKHVYEALIHSNFFNKKKTVLNN